MTVKAIFFGSIGTLVETSDLQRRAFNQAFSEAGLDWNWSAEVYKHLLTKSGGRGRIQDFASQLAWMSMHHNCTCVRPKFLMR